MELSFCTDRFLKVNYCRSVSLGAMDVLPLMRINHVAKKLNVSSCA